MNKKGFTLVELLAVIVILVILSALVVPSVFKMVRNAKENSYEVLIDSFENNARLYVSRHRDEIENHLNTYNYYSLTLEDLKQDNLLKLPVKDPRTDEAIDLNKKIYIVRETDKTLSICYEDRVCYAPIFLVDKITESTNIVSGTTEGLHLNSSTNTYYYRGGNPNNWIEFNGELWRIVKVNSDNTIKIIYEGIKTKTGTDQDGNIGNNTFDNSNINNYNNTAFSISIRTTLRNWYNSSISESNKSKVQSINWCIGKIAYSTSGVAKTTFLSNECSEKTSFGYEIGMLNASDYLYASLDSNCTTSYKTTGDNGTNCKNYNYLYKNVYNYWTLTQDNNSTKLWVVNSTGALGPTIDANYTAHVRPVVNFKNNVYIAQGNGTFDNPYRIKDIVSVDQEKPVITLLGDNPMVIKHGDSFIDPGATAIDNVDGNITNRIIKTTNLNINELGTYEINYVVSDISGNKTSVKRIINVVEKKFVQENLMLWYDFTSKTNASANRNIVDDFSEQNNIGTLYNFAYNDNSGWTKEGLNFDGVDDYVSFQNIPIYNDSFTVSMNVYLTEDDREVFLGDFGLANGINLSLEKHTSGRLRLYWNASPDIYTPTGVVPINSWFYVTYVINKSTSEVIFYINGTEVHRQSATLSPLTPTADIYIGRDSRIDITAFKGKIKTVLIYNRALSLNEILSNVN